MSLLDLEARLRRNLSLYNYPPWEWVPPNAAGHPDVVVLGSGRRALLLALALRQERIGSVRVFNMGSADRRASLVALGVSAATGPRMDFVGPELMVPELEFRAYLSARDTVDIATLHGPALAAAWAEYREWLARMVGLEPITAGAPLAIVSDEGWLRVTFADGSAVRTTQVVLADEFMDTAPADFGYGLPHVAADALAGRTVAVIGAGAEAYDDALMALAAGAQVVHVLPAQSPSSEDYRVLRQVGVLAAYARLPADVAARIAASGAATTIPVPPEWSEAVARHPDYRAVRLAAGEGIADALTGWVNGRFSVDAQRGAGDDLLVRLGVDKDGRLAADAGGGLTLAGYPPGEDGIAVLGVGTRLLPALGPVAAPQNIERYLVSRIVESISRNLFLLHRQALYAAFKSFEAAEAGGGKLAITSTSIFDWSQN